MESKLEIIKEAERSLNFKLAKLEKLEKEKQVLLNRAKNINQRDLPTLEKAMAQSELKYANLLQEVQELNNAVKKLKKTI